MNPGGNYTKNINELENRKDTKFSIKIVVISGKVYNLMKTI
jgi:hypothetical protein